MSGEKITHSVKGSSFATSIDCIISNVSASSWSCLVFSPEVALM